ncbi:MAG: hypothetical protein A2139_14185 [Desulfobacca sp. RBG_16_60_12]|nr:MAG: hypothetical protein A2139_14185 [Desulfobacca sp. RBG_16_60_12]
MDFIEIPAGSFLMGSDKKHDPQAEDNEVPQHEVTLPRYYIARYPVTVAQFRTFVEKSRYKLENEDSLHGLPNHPVSNVTWYDALKYCKWLTERLRGWEGTPEPLATLLRMEGWRVSLPSEAEWEKAARGTDGRIYPWGNDPETHRANYDNATSVVGCFPGRDSPYGVEDMSANIWEWTRSLWGEDWSKPTFEYPYDLKDGREDRNAPDRVFRVLRGGAFWDYQRYVRCAYRYRLYPGYRYWNGGFRVVVLPA